MENLMTSSKFDKEKVISEIKKGNMEVLKGLSPVMAMSVGIAVQNEKGSEEQNNQDQ